MHKKHKKKVIIFLSQPIDKRNIKRFGYHTLKKNFDVKIYDISSLLNSEIDRVYKKNKKKDLIDNKNFFKINNYLHIFKLFKDHKGSYFIDSTTYRSFFFGLLQNYAILNESKKVHITNCSLPKSVHFSKREKINNLIKIRTFFSKDTIKFVLNFLKSRFMNFLYPAPDFAFISGLKEKNSYSKKTQIIFSHCFDYDLFLENNKKKILVSKKKYAVFIETITFGHPDISIGNVESRNAEEIEKKYFTDLKALFYNINKNLDIGIVIALHPRTPINYKRKIKKVYNEKYVKIIDNNTPKYIKNSSLVISHNSSAIQLAILWKKPIIFCYHSEMLASVKKCILGLSAELKKKSFNLENVKFGILKKDFKVIDNHYNNYIKNYIQSSKNSKLSSWENFSEIFKK